MDSQVQSIVPNLLSFYFGRLPQICSGDDVKEKFLLIHIKLLKGNICLVKFPHPVTGIFTILGHRPLIKVLGENKR